MTENLQKDFVLPDNISDEYELISCIKSGEFSSAYILYDKMCQRKVFMKVGRAEIIENEACMLAGLEIDGIPDVYRCFENGNRSYLIRQYINGKTLREQINNNGPFTAKKAIEICISVCGILSALHEKNPPVIHRDIKSDNIVITPEGKVFIIDFGIAREYDGSADRDTQVMGTPETAPPEQFGYCQTDMRSDVYSVGVLLNELVTGSAKINFSGMPKNLASAVKRCTRFEPAKRFENASECRKALNKIYRKTYLKRAAICIICALAAAVMAIVYNPAASDIPEHVSGQDIVFDNDTEAYEEGVRKILLDTEYAGDWKYGGKIPKDILAEYDGDVEIRLELETLRVGAEGNYQMLAPLDNGDRWEHIIVETENNRKENEAWIDLGENQRYCTFVISKEDIDNLSGDYLEFQVYNVLIKSAELKKAFDEETPVIIQLDSEYPGDYAISSSIPKSALENYRGDILLTLEVDVGGAYNYANFLPIALMGKDGYWKKLISEIDCTDIRNNDGYIELKKGQTRCTLVLSKEIVSGMNEDGIVFRAVNVTIKSVSIKGIE